EGAVPGRAGTVLTLGNTAHPSDLRAHLGSREHPAQAGLGALTELDLDHLHRPGGHDLLELLQVEVPLGIAAAEVAGADLQHDVAAVAVVVGQAAFTGVVHDAGQRCPLVQRLDRRAGQGAVTHRRDIDYRLWPEGFGAPAGSTHDLRCRNGCFGISVCRHGYRITGEGAVLQDRIALLEFDIHVGTEAEV